MFFSTSLAIVTPFYSVSFMETVQSDIASEKPGIFDIFREGSIRLLFWGAPSKARMVPIWALILPTVALGLGKYLFSLVIRETTSALLQIKYRHNYEENGAFPRDNTAVVQDIKLTSSIIATIMSDIVFYPCETVVHRLHLQVGFIYFKCFHPLFYAKIYKVENILCLKSSKK